MADPKICIRCGNPVRVSREKYELYDRMHWICYHLEFEHSDYDPDEPCDDPKCPWNRIHDTKKMKIWDPLWTVAIYAEDRRSVFRIKMLEVDALGNTQIRAAVDDRGINKQLDVWVKDEAWLSFNNALLQMEESGEGSALLQSMAPGVLEITIEDFTSIGGSMYVKYSLQDQSWPGFAVGGGFNLDPARLPHIRKSFGKLRRVMDNVTFKEVQEQDLPAILAIYQHYVQNTTATFHTVVPSLDEMRAMLCTDHPLYRAFTIFDEYQVCGYVILDQHKKREAYDETGEVSVYLRPESVGKGIGGLALQHIEQYAREKGLHVLVSTISGRNARSIRLFERHGYTKCAHFKEVGCKFGQYLDVVVYQKIID